MASSIRSVQTSLGLEAPRDDATRPGPREVAWIESRRGKPLHGDAPSQSEAVEALFGRTFATMPPGDDEWRETIHADDRQRVVDALASGRGNGSYDEVYRIALPDATVRTVRDRVLLLDDRWQLRVVSEVTAAPAATSPAWLDVVLDEVILRCDHAGRILEIHGAHELLPASADTLIGRGIADFASLPVAMRHVWSVALDRTLQTQRPQICGYRLDTEAGPRSFEARMMPIGPGSAVVAIRDVGERDQLRERLEHHALHDPLTGLGNLRSLRDRLDGWMRRGPGSKPVALLIVDLDRFKQTNDLRGQSVGDTLLRVVAQRLHREALRELHGRAFDAHDAANPNVIDDRADGDDAHTLASLAVVRVGGDQFAIGWRIDDRPMTFADDDVAMRMASRLIAVLGVPTRVASQTVFVRASIGLAVFPVDALDASALFSQAEAALRRAKLAGRNQVRRHGDDDALARARSQPPNNEAALRAALASDEFLLVYQPKFELSSSLVSDVGGEHVPGAMIAVEALVRWQTPSGALLVPHEFIPLAESSGMIRPLGDWVLRTALAEVSRFPMQGERRVGVAVNISLLQLHDRSFVQTVESALKEHGFAPGELTLEIAETAFLEDVRLVADVVAELSALGVRLAIDHFGVGTAGLVALKSLPVDEIKIDRSFIAGAAIDAFDATIVAGLIDMAHDLGKTVTADGVERVDQIASLSLMRCDAIQGFFVGEPLRASELVATSSLWRRTRGATS